MGYLKRRNHRTVCPHPCQQRIKEVCFPLGSVAFRSLHNELTHLAGGFQTIHIEAVSKACPCRLEMSGKGYFVGVGGCDGRPVEHVV